MGNGFLRVNGKDFYRDDEKVILRGYGIGSWLNLEHFMLGIPGTDSQMRTAIANAYGKDNAKKFWQKFYRAMVDKSDFEFLKSLGVNAVRIAFNYRLFEDDQNPYSYMEEGFEQIDRTLGLCEQYGIYAILDLHSAPGWQNPDWHCDNPTGESLFWEHADFRKRTLALWKHIASHYADNKWVGAYDLMNEPVVITVDRKNLNQVSTDLINEIRKVDKNHIIFVQGDMYSSHFDLFEPFEDPNVACSFHFYPFLFQHLYTKKQSQKEQIEHTLFENVTLKDISERLKRPVWCGETGGLFSDSNKAQQESTLSDILEIYERYGISWSIWTYKDARSMGTMHPKADSPWMRFSASTKQKRDFWDEFKFRDSFVDELAKKYSMEISSLEKRKLGFRILANNQLVMKEVYAKLFKDIPFEEFLGYLDSFKYSNCECWEGVANLVRKYAKPKK
ncbi:MAG: cellulase family glycosylhydrolase [Phycisphaerae bacterium]|nr:cellulase family glycosylhydrolase [Phycisphaerae bacterium]